jgi:Ca2+-binding EF-hand superfamily protein
LNKKGLHSLLDRIGVKDVSAQELDKIFAAIDLDNNGKI